MNSPIKRVTIKVKKTEPGLNKANVMDLLTNSGHMTSRQIAKAIGVEKHAVNQFIYKNLETFVRMNPPIQNTPVWGLVWDEDVCERCGTAWCDMDDEFGDRELYVSNVDDKNICRSCSAKEDEAHECYDCEEEDCKQCCRGIYCDCWDDGCPHCAEKRR
jgi:hypothetical protein